MGDGRNWAVGYQTLDVRRDGRIFGYVDAEHEWDLPGTSVQPLPVVAH
jgi:hypothetical protein